MITVVDYGMGNLRSVQRAFQKLGLVVTITNRPAEINDAGVLVLPGVGAFGEAVKRIDALKLREPIVRHAAQGKSLLGICLGMQLLFECSEENPGARGLAVLSGEVKRFPSTLKVPHIGWNDVVVGGSSDLDCSGCFYFVHSFYVKSTYEIGLTDYGIPFSSAVRNENVFGTQFHPEKSQDAGLQLLRRIIQAMTNKA